MKLITKNRYMKEYGIGYNKMQQMIANHEVEVIGGKIKINEETVSYEEYIRVVKENTELKTTLNLAKNILENGGTKDEYKG